MFKAFGNPWKKSFVTWRQMILPILSLQKKHFACFKPFHQEAEQYAISAAFFSENCIEEMTELLTAIRLKAANETQEEERALDLIVNALVAANAERYYRAMVKSVVCSWTSVISIWQPY
jgi:hypothetical protein